MRNLPLPKKLYDLSSGIRLMPCTVAGSKKQFVPRTSSFTKTPGAHSAALFATTGVPLALLTLPMPPVVMRAGNVLLESPINPISGRYDVFEKLRLAWSSGRCSLYSPEKKTL